MNKKFPQTPLDELILELAEQTFGRSMASNEIPNLVLHQLQQIRNIYIWMREVDFHKKISSQPPGTRSISLEELVLENSIDSYRTYLSYFLFIYTLNQFFRLIEAESDLKEKSKKFPDYKRIKFYRDKVVEHWEEYRDKSINPNATGATFKQGKAAIPLVENIVIPKERKNAKKRLEDAFHAHEFEVKVPDKFLSNGISTMQEYGDLVYGALENDPEYYKTGTKYQVIVEALFQFGFPAPISDVEDYLEALKSYVEDILLK